MKYTEIFKLKEMLELYRGCVCKRRGYKRIL